MIKKDRSALGSENAVSGSEDFKPPDKKTLE
jgi:hypothetical protein